MDLLQPLIDQLERFAQSFFQRGVQLLIHRLPHRLQLLAVVGLQRLDLRLQRLAQALQTQLVALGHELQLLGKAGQLLALLSGVFGQPPQYRFIIMVGGRREFFAQRLGLPGAVLPRPFAFVTQLPLQFVQPGRRLLVDAGGTAQQYRRQNQYVQSHRNHQQIIHSEPPLILWPDEAPGDEQSQ